MKGKPRNSVFTLPGRTYSRTSVGKNSSVYSRQAGHCGSAYSISVTFAAGLPRTRPACGMPARSTTGFAVGGAELESFLDDHGDRHERDGGGDRDPEREGDRSAGRAVGSARFRAGHASQVCRLGEGYTAAYTP